MGFDAWFFGRIDAGEEAKRVEKKEMEWIHKPNNQTFEGSGDYHLFTHKMKNLYFSPHGFDYDVFVDDGVFQTNKKMPTYDANEIAKKFDAYLQNYSEMYATDNLFILMGHDFEYVNAY